MAPENAILARITSREIEATKAAIAMPNALLTNQHRFDMFQYLGTEVVFYYFITLHLIKKSIFDLELNKCLRS